MPKKASKQRTGFRKNREGRGRSTGWTRDYLAQNESIDTTTASERVSGKGELTRKRTVRLADDAASDDASPRLDVDEASCLAGRVLSVHGLTCTVETDAGELYKCAVRRLLKTLSTDQRHVVAAGDLVRFRPADGHEGVIERVEPRHGVISRTSRGKRHTLVVNVDQLLIVASVAEPVLKPNLIDRFLATAEQTGVPAVICLNKVDLVDLADLQPFVGLYAQMGYRVLLVSAQTGFGIDRLRRTLAGKATAVAGQSGVGKSSLLNAVEPGLGLKVASVSEETQKGRHTTTTARWLKLAAGGYVVDTPGIRQMQLWDVIPAEVAGLYRDVRPLVSLCNFPDCTHTHEQGCAVKDAVADGWLDARRYESYCHLYRGDQA